MYENAKYSIPPFQDAPNGMTVEINGVLTFVPLDPANSDYAKIMELVEAGELTIAEPEAPE